MGWFLIRFWLSLLCAAVMSTAAFALDVVAEGEAVIENEDVTLARKLALRRAMSSAIEQSGGMLQATTISTPDQLKEHTSLSSRNQVLGTRVVSEHIEKGKLKLIAEVKLAGPGQPLACAERPLRKALVTAFPLQLPEQLASGEYLNWPTDTAQHLARVFNASNRLLSAAAPNRIPFVTLEGFPEPERSNGIPKLVGWAQAERAQYVVAGVFRDFGTTRKAFVLRERQLIVEAYIYDGISGELIARKEFTRVLLGTVRLPKTIVFGGKDFCESVLGSAYLDLMAELARWAEATIGCMPFSTRVIRADNKQIYVDAGSDSGLEPGMELVLTRHKTEAVSTAAGDIQIGETKPLAGVVIKSVTPRYSVAEITARKNPPKAQVGDVLYGL